GPIMKNSERILSKVFAVSMKKSYRDFSTERCAAGHGRLRDVTEDGGVKDSRSYRENGGPTGRRGVAPSAGPERDPGRCDRIRRHPHECARRDRGLAVAPAPIGGPSVEQVADLLTEPAQDAGLGLADGDGSHAESRANVGGFLILDGREPEHLPGA